MPQNNDTVQQYIDRLTEDATKAEQAWSLAKAVEEQKVNKLTQVNRLCSVFSDLLNTISETNKLGMVYLGTLQRTGKQTDKVGENAKHSLAAIRILICESKGLLDCLEVLAGEVKKLSDRIGGQVVAKGNNSIMGSLNSLKTSIDEAITASKEAVNALLDTFHSEKELRIHLAGPAGLGTQVKHLKNLLLYANKNGKCTNKNEAVACSACKPRDKDIFPMDDSQNDFYSDIFQKYTTESNSLKTLQQDIEVAAGDRAMAEAKKEALKKALEAALAAKADAKK
ncbi:hypothetical protein LX64_01634 [Chitinophaga skermanii]|uniref:Uncharacterized protein n=1 Tax=Chitinophaga skermanii TaxID=331697 RepID=A0A327QXY4_9BACT|nr:hypothetical protein [Chitinophaga skermanii]RAJ06507.1 hypothetical protein LX64_01634 [Chitinophaga skermanii]